MDERSTKLVESIDKYENEYAVYRFIIDIYVNFHFPKVSFNIWSYRIVYGFYFRSVELEDFNRI